MENKIYRESESLFHHTIKVQTSETQNGITAGIAIVTGYSKERLNVGDTVLISLTPYEIKEIIEVRDHAGVFKNEDDRKDAYFKVSASFRKKAANV